MKKKLFLTLLHFSMLLRFVNAQETDSFTLSKLKLNFVVPDIPAFKSLGTEPSDILRPSTPQAIAFSFSEFYQGGRLILPKAFALEVSPSLLLNANKGPQQLEYYARNATLNSFRISLGSSTDTFLSPSGRSLALGFRLSLINKGDLGTDTAYQRKILAELRKFRQNISREELMQEFARSKGKNYGPDDIDSLDIFITRNKKEFNEFLATHEIQKRFAKSMEELKDAYKKDHWNDTKLDLAVAILASSPDSSAKNILFNNASLWMTYGLKVGKKSQLLIGLHARYYKNLLNKDTLTNDKFYTDISVPVRFLFGTNRIKGCMEAQYKYAATTSSNTLLGTAGVEMNLHDGIWINLYGGLSYDSKLGSGLVSNLSMKFTIPEKFDFF